MSEPSTEGKRLAFVASPAAEAQEALADLSARYGNRPLDEADVIVALGGDGFMLRTMHASIERGTPVYGMNRGSVGFMMNNYGVDDLPARIQRAEQTTLHRLRMRAHLDGGKVRELAAINEVSLLRQSREAAKLRVIIDGVVRIEEMICDGVLVATPAGSTAYNFSARGPILPIGCDLLALTPLSPFRPRRWPGAVLPGRSRVQVVVIDRHKRPVAAVADSSEVRNVAEVEIAEDRSVGIHVLFDPGHGLEERVLREQFQP